MKKRTIQASKLRIFLLALAFPFVLVSHAHAYLDPGTGSIMLQVLVGGLLAAFYVLRNKTKWWLSRIWKRKSKN